MSELLVFEDVDMKEGEGKWPVEVLLTLGDSGEISVLDRDTYKELHAETLPSTEETTPPGNGVLLFAMSWHIHCMFHSIKLLKGND